MDKTYADDLDTQYLLLVIYSNLVQAQSFGTHLQSTIARSYAELNYMLIYSTIQEEFWLRDMDFINNSLICFLFI